MPNWCEGTLKVRGTIKDLKNFVLNGLIPVNPLGATKEPLSLDGEDETSLYISSVPNTLYVKGTHRAFCEPDYIEVSSDEPNDKTILTMPFKQVWTILSDNLLEVCKEFNVVHSKCYTLYGLKRTGCAGCPFGREYQFVHDILKQYEPKLCKAIDGMWGEVYEYTNKYHEFQKMMNRKYKEKKKCVCGCTEFTGDDVAMNLKYFGRDVKTLLCRGCFQNIMEMTDEQWDEAIDGFKAQGCELF